MSQRPVLPNLDNENVPQVLKDYLKALQEDRNPKITQYTPTITGLTGGLPSGTITRVQGRFWMISLVIGAPSTTVSAYFDLPFNVLVTSLIHVKLADGTMHSGYCDMNEKRVHLPNWTAADSVIIYGIVGE